MIPFMVIITIGQCSNSRIRSFRFNLTVGDNVYVYNQILSSENRSVENMLQTMRNDLNSFFGFEATIENRLFPVLELIATEDAQKLLKSSGKKTSTEDSFAGVKYCNVPIERLIDEIVYKTYLVGRDSSNYQQHSD